MSVLDPNLNVTVAGVVFAIKEAIDAQASPFIGGSRDIDGNRRRNVRSGRQQCTTRHSQRRCERKWRGRHSQSFKYRHSRRRNQTAAHYRMRDSRPRDEASTRC
jgi:hypothetical protein